MLFLIHESILNFKQSNLSWASQSLTLGYCKRNSNGISYPGNGNKIISNFIITCEERMATTHVRLELGRLFRTNPCEFFWTALIPLWSMIFINQIINLTTKSNCAK